MSRLMLFIVVGFGLSCSDAPPLAPAAAGKAACALCDFLGDDRYTLTEREVPAADSTKAEAEEAIADPEAIPEILSFADDALEQAVREALNKPHRPLTGEDIPSLTVLKADDLGITSLEGLQYWTALDTLELRRNEITDLTPLASLTNLRVLHLWGNDVADLSPLKGLTKLQTLGLWGNAVKDVSALAALDSLQWVQLGDNEIEDLSPLLELTELQWLGVVDNPLSHPSAGDHFSALQANDTAVQVDTSTSEAIDPVDDPVDPPDDRVDPPDDPINPGPMMSLLSFGAFGAFGANAAATPANNVSDPHLNSITDSDLRAVVQQALNDLGVGGSLTELATSDANITSLEGLENYTTLEDLDLSGTSISDVTPLKSLTNLQTLDLSDTDVVHWHLLVYLENLETLNLAGTNVVIMAPFVSSLSKLPNLQELNLNSTPLTSTHLSANSNIIQGLRTRADDNDYDTDVENVEVYCEDTTVCDSSDG